MTAQPGSADREQVTTATSVPRRRLLELLRESPAALDGYELGQATGLHVTTVRFHLEQLLTAGLITAATQPRSTPGRPRTVYRAIALPVVDHDRYQPLAALLAAHLGGSMQIRRRRAETAGRAWARSLIPASDHLVGHAEATRQVTALLTSLNFQPELAEPANTTQDIRLHGCPYRDVARQHPEVVCSIHLGLLRGAFIQLGRPLTEVILTPFVEPGLCAIHVKDPPPSISAAVVD